MMASWMSSSQKIDATRYVHSLDEPLSGHFIRGKKVIGDKDSVKIMADKIVQFKFDYPIVGKILIAVIHRHIDLKHEIIKKNSFEVYTASTVVKTTKTYNLGGEVKVTGLVIKMSNEKTIEIQFNGLSKEIGKRFSNYWNFMVIPITNLTRDNYVPGNFLKLRAQENIQVLRRVKVGKGLEVARFPEWVDKRFPLAMGRLRNSFIKQIMDLQDSEIENYKDFSITSLLENGIKYHKLIKQELKIVIVPADSIQPNLPSPKVMVSRGCGG